MTDVDINQKLQHPRRSLGIDTEVKRKNFQDEKKI